MTKFKKIKHIALTIGAIAILTGCGTAKEKDIAADQTFEYKVNLEEYMKNQGEITDRFKLTKNTEYEMALNANCNSGTMEIEVCYNNKPGKTYFVNENTACNRVISFKADETGEATFKVKIHPDTKGDIASNLVITKSGGDEDMDSILVKNE